jgi:hypothetical protein
MVAAPSSHAVLLYRWMTARTEDGRSDTSNGARYTSEDGKSDLMMADTHLRMVDLI